MTIQDVVHVWPIISAILAGVYAAWRWIVAREARREVRLARIERDIAKVRADTAERLAVCAGHSRDIGETWRHVEQLHNEVSKVEQGVARIEGALGIRNGQ